MREQDEKIRAEFEAEVHKLELGAAKRDGEYVRADVRDMWKLWKASRAQSDLAHQADREELASAKLLLEWQKTEIARLRSWQGLHEQVQNRNEELHEQLAAAQLAIGQMQGALNKMPPPNCEQEALAVVPKPQGVGK